MPRREVVTVAGAGAFGLSVALALVRKGLAVEVWDPADALHSASGVAAGMLAASVEAVLDGLQSSGRDLLLAAQAQWRADALDLDLPLDRSGTLLPALDVAYADLLFRRFEAFEDVRLLDGAQARAMQPWLGEAVRAAVFMPRDWRLDPHVALAALRCAVSDAGGVLRRESLPPDPSPAGPLVIATGYAARAFRLPELSRLSPIKGQVARLSGGPAEGPTVRTEGAYVAPQAGGAIVGATMEAGRDDTEVEPAALARLLAAARAVMPGLEGLAATGMAGVRATTPDGLPLVGPSSRKGVLLAVGARRNGWLLAPLVGRMVAAYLTGDDPGPYAACLDPRRFDR